MSKNKMKLSIKKLRENQNRVCYNWGFQFALWCALLWGICYQLLEILISGDRFLHMQSTVRNPYAVGTVLAIVLGVMIAAVSVIWVCISGSGGEIRKTLCASKKLGLYILAEALVGGLAAWATYVTAGLLNTLFAVVGVMFYPVLGSALASRWLHEHVSNRIRAGMWIILAGLGLFYFQTIVGGAWGSAVWTGCLLGALTGVGWGLEGAIAGKVTELVDSENGVAVRFLCEAVIWVLAFVIYTVADPQNLVWIYMKALFQDGYSMLMLFIIALCLTFNYFSWYQSFALIGVTKGLVISDVSGFVTVLAGMLLATSMPAWLDIIAALVMMFGVLWIYWYGIREIGMCREGLAKICERKLSGLKSSGEVPLKSRVLLYIAAHCPIWDYQVADKLCGQGRSRDRRRNKIRTYMIEACASGIVVNVEDAVDEEGLFQKGKLLSKYGITKYGYELLTEIQLIQREEKKNHEEFH